MTVPDAVLHTMHKQLSIGTCKDAAIYGGGEQRWLHAMEIRSVYGYVEITEPKAAFRLTRWLYALCWTGNDGPSVLFEWAVACLVMHKVLLPACTTLERSSLQPAGFPSLPKDHIEHPLNLAEYLIENKAATFPMREVDSMQDAGILDSDLLVVDRARFRSGCLCWYVEVPTKFQLDSEYFRIRCIWKRT